MTEKKFKPVRRRWKRSRSTNCRIRRAKLRQGRRAVWLSVFLFAAEGLFVTIRDLAMEYFTDGSVYTRIRPLSST
jgi:hypothetical protein